MVSCAGQGPEQHGISPVSLPRELLMVPRPQTPMTHPELPSFRLQPRLLLTSGVLNPAAHLDSLAQASRFSPPKAGSIHSFLTSGGTDSPPPPAQLGDRLMPSSTSHPTSKHQQAGPESAPPACDPCHWVQATSLSPAPLRQPPRCSPAPQLNPPPFTTHQPTTCKI